MAYLNFLPTERDRKLGEW